jgi:hypothetical protein
VLHTQRAARTACVKRNSFSFRRMTSGAVRRHIVSMLLRSPLFLGRCSSKSGSSSSSSKARGLCGAVCAARPWGRPLLPLPPPPPRTLARWPYFETPCAARGVASLSPALLQGDDDDGDGSDGGSGSDGADEEGRLEPPPYSLEPEAAEHWRALVAAVTRCVELFIFGKGGGCVNAGGCVCASSKANAPLPPHQHHTNKQKPGPARASRPPTSTLRTRSASRAAAAAAAAPRR